MTTELASSKEVSIQMIELVFEYSVGKPFVFSFPRTSDIRKIPHVLLNLIDLHIQSHFFRNYRFDFLHQDLNQKIYIYTKKFDAKGCLYVRWLRVLMDRLFQNDLLVFIHHEIQTPFLRNYEFDIFHQVLNEQTSSCGGARTERPAFCFLRWTFHSSKMPNNSYF